METYRLKSKMVDNEREYVIQTSNDAHLSSVASLIYVNGELTETVAASHPREIESSEILSLVKLRHGEVKKEVEVLLEAYGRVLSEGNPQAMLHLAMAFFYRRFYEESSRLLRGATQIDPEFHQAFNYLCLSEIALDNPDDAIKAGTESTRLRPGFADYRNNLGEAYLQAASCRQALDEFDAATKINLYYADAYVNMTLALILNAINEQELDLAADVYSRGTDYLKRVTLIAPEYKTDQFKQGVRCFTDTDLEGAYRYIKQARDAKRERHRQEFSTFYMKYVLYPEWASETAVADRVKFLKAEIEKNPNYVDLYTELGRCYLEQAKMSWTDGLEQYRKAVSMNPSLANIDDAIRAAEYAMGEIEATLKQIASKG